MMREKARGIMRRAVDRLICLATDKSRVQAPWKMRLARRGGKGERRMGTRQEGRENGG